jgi:6,7-dimethyl-8-ribityllumazine synthase
MQGWAASPGTAPPATCSNQRVGENPDAELDGGDLNITILVARLHDENVGRRLLRGAQEALERHGVPEPDVLWVPTPLDLPVTALALAEKGGPDAIVCLGCIVRDETAEFDAAVMQTASGLMQVQLDTGVPIAFGVLATDDRDLALGRSGPKNNRGAEAAESAIAMANLLREIQG